MQWQRYTDLEKHFLCKQTFHNFCVKLTSGSGKFCYLNWYNSGWNREKITRKETAVTFFGQGLKMSIKTDYTWEGEEPPPCPPFVCTTVPFPICNLIPICTTAITNFINTPTSISIPMSSSLSPIPNPDFYPYPHPSTLFHPSTTSPKICNPHSNSPTLIPVWP